MSDEEEEVSADADVEEETEEQSIEDQVLAIAEPQLREAGDKLKDSFLASFGEFVEEAHKDRLEKLFTKAGEYKIRATVEKDPGKARQYEQAYESSVRSIETLGLAAEIKAEAKAASLIKEAAKLALDTLGNIAFSLIKTIGGALVAGVVQGVVGPTGAKILEEGGTAIAEDIRDAATAGDGETS